MQRVKDEKPQYFLLYLPHILSSFLWTIFNLWHALDKNQKPGIREMLNKLPEMCATF